MTSLVAILNLLLIGWKSAILSRSLIYINAPQNVYKASRFFRRPNIFLFFIYLFLFIYFFKEQKRKYINFRLINTVIQLVAKKLHKRKRQERKSAFVSEVKR